MSFILTNRPLLSAVIAMLLAQFLKPFVSWALDKKFSYHLFFTTGGMPSSHTSAVVALTTSIYIIEGLKSMQFAISFVFAAIVIHDAMSIRRAAGKQAEVINEWSRILTKIHEDGQFTPENLKTMLGHNFTQVSAGLILGFVIAILVTVVLA
ncbi:MAG: divergent PAP2 family protein [Sphaerochaetaceae bacterium]|jgi:acid phosphatase family membrane protein YuiD|nr:divergent PAP2 family protein [Sphaerochaetaceae bacterium]NLO61759.1 divergent PAP2 family protein [Spirochaetales bacterium]MDD2405451.1 divergent PAP2 family protein [Sphaerochaetaceae bacterium]MDD3671412.1 divergent PAP2 family protein [Sphaerochaetaceae bacterium]MDD4259373.1 divergent PAP2 family protein [Sphaerochaetaceae bacterium]